MDFIWLGLNLPDSSGAETYTKLNAHIPGVPIVVISNQDDTSSATDALKRGARDYLVSEELDKNILERSLRYAFDRLDLEKQLFQSQKMAELGHLAGGVAHDFNNLLTVILGSLDLIRLAPDDTKSILDNIDEILQAAKRGSNLTRQLLLFSRHKMIKATPLYLNLVIKETMEMLRRVIPRNIKLTTECVDKLCVIKADSGHVEQVVMNLVVNAINAMPEGGEIVIKTSNLFLKKHMFKWSKNHVTGNFVVLTITDKGTGIENDILSKIFNPFFTTKRSEEGSGLGLSVVFGIVKQSGGYIEVTSEPGAGTTFDIYLPRIEQSYKTIGKSCGETTAFPQRVFSDKNILIVEDDAPLRSMVCKFLRINGYNVLQAIDGEKALAVCCDFPGSVQILLTDLSLPGNINGADLSRRLEAKYPDIKVIYTSGSEGKTLLQAQSVNMGPGLIYLEKPYRLADLSLKIRHILETKTEVKDTI